MQPDTTTTEPVADEITADEIISTDVGQPDPPASDDAPAEDSAAADDEASPNSEAAKYRRKLREAETERDALRARVEDLTRGEVERAAAALPGHKRLADPADLWLGGVTLTDVLDDSGAVDPAKVDAAVTKVLADHPNWKKPPMDFGGGARGRVVDHDSPADIGAGIRKVAGYGQ